MIDLNELGQGLPAITPAWGSAMAEAAGVCLESQGHTQGVLLGVTGHVNSSHVLAWPPIGGHARRSWADLQEATEYGATAIAVLLVKREAGYAAVERSAKGTGIDYWLGHEAEGPPFQNKARLEVSGILSAQDAQRDVAKRVREKMNQAQSSGSSLPTYVVVVEFGSPLSQVQTT